MVTDVRRKNVEEFALSVFRKSGAILENGHYVYNSGRHGSEYVLGDALCADGEELSTLMFYLSEMVLDSGFRKQAEVILAPAVGGIPPAMRFAEHMSKAVSRKIYFTWAEKSSASQKNPFTIPEAFKKYIAQKNVFLVDDVVTTGIAFRNLSGLVRNLGGNVLGAACLWTRSRIQSYDIGAVPLFSLIEKQFESWKKEDCPLCKSLRPINTDYGHGEEFLEKMKRS